ncbi:hypothetical protein ACFT2C_06325 [Promicromonospora sp. NPDC057138]|uniref:hypothetical protein n=1 Tax=Promicromonospora sp. NPDC057138 TaxID=3346031 RepID=UPI003631E5D4
MGTQDQIRRPAGAPESAGGQFATASRPEAAVRIGDPLRPRVDAVRDFVERSAPVNLQDEHVLSREAARAGVRGALPGMAEVDFERHWISLEQAAVQLQRFALDEDGEEPDGAPLGDLCGVRIEDFRGYDDLDRPNEAGGYGYDWPAISEAVADAWSECCMNAPVLQ